MLRVFTACEAFPFPFPGAGEHEDRIILGYIAVPAYKGSLAEAKGACNQTKLVQMSTESLELSSGEHEACGQGHLLT
eukprot:1143273-Pelagomonas_calceolata.AAC.5